MFQFVFRAQDGALMLWPLAAMLIFVAVFAAQLVRILRASPVAVEHQARLPLEADLPPAQNPDIGSETAPGGMR